MKFPAVHRQKLNSAIGWSIERMVRLESADQNACVYQHVLNAVRIDAVTPDGVIA
jgi:hypothetical protein